MSILTEEWRPIAGFEEVYEVSSLGQVRSCARVITRRKADGSIKAVKLTARIMKTHINATGHASVKLCDNKHRYVHQLVAAAFIGEQPAGTWVLHGPNGVSDNSASNVYYGTPKQNAADRLRDGTVARGERNAKSKLSSAQVIKIKALADCGTPITHIAKKFNISPKAVRLIRDNVNWKWLEAA